METTTALTSLEPETPPLSTQRFPSDQSLYGGANPPVLRARISGLLRLPDPATLLSVAFNHPTSKADRLANYVMTLRKELLAVSRACGHSPPSLVKIEQLEILDQHYAVFLKPVNSLNGDCREKTTSWRSRHS